MQQKLLTIETEALSAIDEAGSLKELNELKVRYLGKKGVVTELLRGMDSLSASERPLVGQMINEIKKNLSERFAATEKDLEKAIVVRRLQDEKIDISIPGLAFPRGTRHPLSIMVEEIEDIFIGMGYCIEEGPEVELDLYNFELLNMPKNHPARDMQDSFYFSDSVLLRTHTSPMQARTMKSRAPKLPVKIICPGTVYRRDDDATHSPMFHQVEGLFVGECVSLADLKGTLLYFARQMFGADREIRLRPSYFPFTEPSAEVDISCFICGGGGCRLCKNTGWIEILGSGMVHPNVLSMCGYNPKEVSGFAFGMGVERIAMLKYGISDMRLFFDNDIRFLEQF